MKEIPWMKNPPTSMRCSFLWNGYEHHFEWTIHPKYGLTALKTGSTILVKESHCSSWIPPENFSEMKKVALAVMRASDEQRVRWRDDYLANKPLELPPNPPPGEKKKKKEDIRQTSLL